MAKTDGMISDQLKRLDKLERAIKVIFHLSVYKQNHDQLLYDFQEIHKVAAKAIKQK